MKLLYYYLLIILPLVGCYFLMRENSSLGTGSLLIYLFIYRAIVDYYKLKSKGSINNITMLQMFNPFTRGKYFRELYLS